MNKRVVVIVPKDDEWVLEYLTKIVETKKTLGIKSTLSFELFRLAKNQLTSLSNGSVMDKVILDDLAKKTS